MHLKPLCMRCITWPMRMGQIFPNIWNRWPRFVYSLCNLHGFAINVSLFICQNGVRPCVKGQRDVCACAKSLNLSVGCQKQLNIWNLRPQSADSLYNLYRLWWRLKVVYIWACPMLKPFSGEYFKSRPKRVQNGSFWGKEGLKFSICFATPRSLCQNPCASWLWAIGITKTAKK